MQLIGADDAVFNAMVFGEPPPQVRNYVAQSMARAEQTLGAAGQWLITQANTAYAAVRDDNAMAIAMAAFRTVQSLWGTNQFQYLQHIHQVQNAPTVMVRWIMADPTLRALHQQGITQSYGDRYIDSDPNGIGNSHVDYRLLMSGIIKIPENPEQDGWGHQFTTHFQPTEIGEIELTHMQKDQILVAQEIAREAIFQKRDPTSRQNMSIE